MTGAAGFLGNNLVRELLSRGCRVRAAVHDSADNLAGLDVEIVRVDVREPETLAAAYAGADRVFHLVAIISLLGDQRGRVPAVNVEGARNSARAALEAGVRRYVHFSSIHAFDLRDKAATIDEETPRAGRSQPAYDRSKAAGEREVREVIAEGLDGVIVHPTGVFGPHDFYPSPFGDFLMKLGRGKAPMLVEGGFNWVDVRDVCAGAIAAAERGRTGESYILGGSYQTVRALAALARGITEAPSPWFVTPMWLARAAAPLMDLWGWLGFEPVYTSEALHPLRGARDIPSTKARQELGYTSRPTEESLRDLYSWMQENASPS